MDQEHVRKLLIAEYGSYTQILDSKGVAFEPPYSDEELVKLPLQDLKSLVNHVRDLGRTPSGNR